MIPSSSARTAVATKWQKPLTVSLQQRQKVEVKHEQNNVSGLGTMMKSAKGSQYFVRVSGHIPHSMNRIVYHTGRYTLLCVCCNCMIALLVPSILSVRSVGVIFLHALLSAARSTTNAPVVDTIPEP